MVTVREQMLLDEYRKLRKEKVISMDEVEDLMYQIEKVFMEITRVTESRDKWKTKYQELKNAKKH